jgi:hypothetical protein
MGLWQGIELTKAFASIYQTDNGQISRDCSRLKQNSTSPSVCAVAYPDGILDGKGFDASWHGPRYMCRATPSNVET